MEKKAEADEIEEEVREEGRQIKGSAEAKGSRKSRWRKSRRWGIK